MTIADVDRAVARVLESKFRLGLFDRPCVDAAGAGEHTRTPQQIGLARRIAADSLVLLRNDGVLPLRSPASVAVIGPNAATPRNMVGDYAYICHVESLLDMARSGGSVFAIPIDRDMTIDDFDDLSHVGTVLDSLSARMPEATIRYRARVRRQRRRPVGVRGRGAHRRPRRCGRRRRGRQGRAHARLHDWRDARRRLALVARRAGAARAGGRRHRHPRRARARGRPPERLARGPRRGRGCVARVAAGRGGRRRDRRRPDRRRQSGWQASGQLPAQLRADPGVLRAQGVRRALVLARRVRRHVEQPAVPVRVRSVVHDVRGRARGARRPDRHDR